jgi:hypothetical protein
LVLLAAASAGREDSFNAMHGADRSSSMQKINEMNADNRNSSMQKLNAVNAANSAGVDIAKLFQMVQQNHEMLTALTKNIKEQQEQEPASGRNFGSGNLSSGRQHSNTDLGFQI